MKLLLVYPAWPKLEHQTEFNLPPHGPVVFAAALPPGPSALRTQAESLIK